MGARPILLGLLCAAGCGEAAPGGFVTEHLIIEPTDSEVVCRGTLDDLEAQVVRVAGLLDVEVREPIEVYYGASAVEERCRDIPGIGGCTDGLYDETFVASGFISLYHELVHAVRFSNGIRGPSFFEEGIAVVLSGFRPYPYSLMAMADRVPSEQGPATLARGAGRIDPDDYGVAAHFMAWLIATRGQAEVTAFLNDPRLADAVDVVFTDHFAVSLDDAEQDWRATSEPTYTFGEVCDPARALAWSGDGLTYGGRLACEAARVSGPELGFIATRGACVPLERPEMVRVELVASSGEVTLRHQDDCLAVGPLPAEYYQDKRLDAGETITAPFAPSRGRSA